jgi:hypothetical protein
MRYSLLLLAALSLAACVVEGPARPRTTTSTTYSSSPPGTYVSPGETATMTVRLPH